MYIYTCACVRACVRACVFVGKQRKVSDFFFSEPNCSCPVYLDMNPSKEKKEFRGRDTLAHTFKKLQQTHVANDLTNHGKKRLFKIQFNPNIRIYCSEKLEQASSVS